MIEEISEDLYRIEMPLPELYPKSVNAYVIRDRDRNLIIDTGLQDDKCLCTIEDDLKYLNIDLKKTDIFITHGHGDHVGLVFKLIHAGSVLYVNKSEAGFIRKMESGKYLHEIQNFYQMSGLAGRDLEKITWRLINFTPRGSLRFQFLKDGDTIVRGGYRFVFLETPGHNKGHMCLYEADRKMFISGDHLLKDIVPPIPGRTNNDNPLGEYLLSIDKVYALDIERTLPGHGQPFNNSKQRMREIKEYHLQKNCELLSILEEGAMKICEIAMRMTRRKNYSSTTLSIFQSFLASQEVYTRLRYLEEEGKVERGVEKQVAIYRKKMD